MTENTEGWKPVKFPHTVDNDKYEYATGVDEERNIVFVYREKNPAIDHHVAAEELGAPWPPGSPRQVRLSCLECEWTKVVDAGVEKKVQDWANEHVEEMKK